MTPRFTWDRNKREENLRKHGVSCEEASSVFRDPLRRAVPDVEHSEREERWVTVGLSDQGRLLGVVHIDIEKDEALTIRIISARPLSRRERMPMSTASNRANDEPEIPALAFPRGIRGLHAAHFKRTGSEQAGSSVRQDVWAPLTEFSWGGTDYQLASDTWIKKTIPIDLIDRKETEEFLSKEERNSCRETPHWLHFVRAVHDEPSPAAAVNSVLLALWLVRPTATHVPVRLAQTPSEFSLARVLDRFQWVPGSVADSITDADLDALARILPPLRDVYASGRRLRNAVVLTFRGCVSVDWQSAFICFTAAAEAMLTYSSEPGITERLARTHGRLVATSASNREAAAARFKKVYAVRSDIVHGRSHDRNRSKQNLIDLAECSHLVRSLWRVVLESDQVRGALERDDAGRRSFLTDSR